MSGTKVLGKSLVVSLSATKTVKPSDLLSWYWCACNCEYKLWLFYYHTVFVLRFHLSVDTVTNFFRLSTPVAANCSCIQEILIFQTKDSAFSILSEAHSQLSSLPTAHHLCLQLKKSAKVQESLDTYYLLSLWGPVGRLKACVQGVLNKHVTETFEYRKKSQVQAVTWTPATCNLGMHLGSHITWDPETPSAFNLHLTPSASRHQTGLLFAIPLVTCWKAESLCTGSPKQTCYRNFWMQKKIPGPGCDLNPSHMQSRHALREPHHLGSWDSFCIQPTLHTFSFSPSNGFIICYSSSDLLEGWKPVYRES